MKCCGSSAPLSPAGAATRIEWTSDGTTWHGADLSTATVLHGTSDTSTGYAVTVPAAATATRALAAPDGSVVEAAVLQSAALAALADLFAVVVADGTAIPD